MCVNGKTNPENDTRPVAVYGIWIRRSFHSRGIPILNCFYTLVNAVKLLAETVLTRFFFSSIGVL